MSDASIDFSRAANMHELYELLAKAGMENRTMKTTAMTALRVVRIIRAYTALDL